MRRSFLATGWSVPLGIVEGIRVARDGVLHNSLLSEDLYLRAAAAAASVMLFYAAFFFLAGLAGALAGTVLERWTRLSRAQAVDVAVFVALLAGLLLALDPFSLGDARGLVALLLLWALAGIGFLLWMGAAHGRRRQHPLRARAAGLYAASLLLFGAVLVLRSILTVPASLVLVLLLTLVLPALMALLWKRRVLAQLIVLLALALVLLAGAAAPDVLPVEEPQRAGETRPILLITVDTLRADALSCYGAAAEATPGVDRLAREGVLFTRAHAPSPWTIPSVYAMLTSRLPHELAMTRPGASYRLADEVPRLPELLPRRYRSRAVVTNVFGASRWGSWKGFESIESVDLGSVVADSVLQGLLLPRLLAGARPLHHPYTEARADRVTRRALRQIEALAGTDFLLWVHYYDPHTPYDPPPPFDELHDERGGPAELARRGNLSWIRAGAKLEEKARRKIRSLYEGEVRYVDSQLALLWEALEERGLWSRTLVILASDHGEEFWEHGSVEHGHTLYEELVRVPLIVKLPGERHAGRRVHAPASLLDVAPTILDLIEGAEGPPSDLRGQSLLPLIETGTSRERPLYFEGVAHYRELKGSLQWPWKLVLDPASGETELYDLERDGGETRDLSRDEPERTGSMLRSIQPYLDSERAAPGTQQPDEELQRRLRALGYIQ